MPGWDELPSDLQARARRQRAALVTLCGVYAQRWEAEAKIGAPWQDRTGNARNTLNGRAVIFDSSNDHYTVGVRLAHGMDYGIWLEIKPTRRGPRQDGTWAAVRYVMGDIGTGPRNRAEFIDRARRVIASA